MGNAPRAKLAMKRAELGPRQNETRQSGNPALLTSFIVVVLFGYVGTTIYYSNITMSCN